MTQDERRRLVYELLLEVKDLQKQSKAAESEFKRISDSARTMQRAVKGAFALFGLGTLQSLLSASKEMQQLREQMRDLGETFADAALKASGLSEALDDVDTAMDMEQKAEDLGYAVGKVVSVFVELGKASRYLIDPMHKFNEAQIEAAALAQGFTFKLPEGAENLSALIPPARVFTEPTTALIDLNAELVKYGKLAKDAANAARDLRQEQRAAREEAAFNRGALQTLVTQLGGGDPRSHATRLQDEANALEASVRTMHMLVTESADLASNIQEISTTAPVITEELQASWRAMEEWTRLTEDAASVLAHAFVGIFSGATHNARDFFRTVLEGLAEVAAQQAFMAAFASGDGKQGGGFIAEFLRGLFAAKGAAFDRGQLQAYARGGVVGSPTMFASAAGLGVMGEAGPEAIMPLKRTAHGELGVHAAPVKVQLINHSGVLLEARAITRVDLLQVELRAMTRGAELAVAEINRSLSTGYGPTAQNLQGLYGLRRR